MHQLETLVIEAERLLPKSIHTQRPGWIGARAHKPTRM